MAVLRPIDALGEPSRSAGWAAYRAWRTTALTLIVVGVLVSWLSGSPALPSAGTLLGIALVLTGVVTLAASRRRWRAINLAIRTGRPLPATRLPLLVSGVVTGASLLLVMLLLVGGRR